MSEFKREERYLVLKLSRLTEVEIQSIKHNVNRYNWDKALTECVVVESDWPIYEQVWDMVQRMAEGRPQQLDGIVLLDLLSRIRQACGDNGKRMQDELVDHIADVSKMVDQLKQHNLELMAQVDRLKSCLGKAKTLTVASRQFLIETKTLLKETPQQSLAEHDADVVRRFAGWVYASPTIGGAVQDIVQSKAEEYANQLRQQAEKKSD